MGSASNMAARHFPTIRLLNPLRPGGTIVRPPSYCCRSRSHAALYIQLAQPRWRLFSTSYPRRITGEEAPSAKAYINSGVIAGAKNPVNVKKVLVIGSGGLSIGQAGEFDYSGMLLILLD